MRTRHREHITRSEANPQVIGKPGAGLASSPSWAVNADVAEIGHGGEVRTAEILNRLAVPGGPTVLHDLVLPMSSIKANIDHVVVSGRTVTCIDTKVWKPGVLWTMFGTTRRGWSRFEPADKKTMDLAAMSVAALLRNSHIQAKVAMPVIVVWPSNKDRGINIGWYRPIGARAVLAETAERRASQLFGSDPADPAIVEALTELVTSVRADKEARRKAIQPDPRLPPRVPMPADLMVRDDFPL